MHRGGLGSQDNREGKNSEEVSDKNKGWLGELWISRMECELFLSKYPRIGLCPQDGGLRVSRGCHPTLFGDLLGIISDSVEDPL